MHSNTLAGAKLGDYAEEVQFGPDIDAFLEAMDARLEPHLRRSLARVPEVACLRDGVSYQIRTGGKRIRAALCATICELFCGSYLRALEFAAAVELLQNFTLIHDDIADGDPSRRGRDAIWRQFGIAHGINIGDIFVPLSALSILESPYEDALKLKLLRTIAEFGMEVAEGQSLDVNLRRNDAPTREAYAECTRKKTGAFLAMATVGGALIGGASDAHVSAVREYAMLAGTAFQIKDDVIDLTGGKGRQVGSDILEGKRTLLSIHAAENASESERGRLLDVLNAPRDRTAPADVRWVMDLYARTGAIEHAEEVANQLVDSAAEFLLQLPNTAAKFRLILLSRHLSRRLH